jgi:hypothetical protein
VDIRTRTYALTDLVTVNTANKIATNTRLVDKLHECTSRGCRGSLGRETVVRRTAAVTASEAASPCKTRHLTPGRPIYIQGRPGTLLHPPPCQVRHLTPGSSLWQPPPPAPAVEGPLRYAIYILRNVSLRLRNVSLRLRNLSLRLRNLSLRSRVLDGSCF